GLRDLVAVDDGDTPAARHRAVTLVSTRPHEGGNDQHQQQELEQAVVRANKFKHRWPRRVIAVQPDGAASNATKANLGSPLVGSFFGGGRRVFYWLCQLVRAAIGWWVL